MSWCHFELGLLFSTFTSCHILTALVRAIKKIGSAWCFIFILCFTLKTYDLFQTVGVKFTRSLHSRRLIYYAYSSLLMNRNLVTPSPIWKGEWEGGQVFIWSLAFCPQTCCPAWSTGSELFHAHWLLVVKSLSVCFGHLRPLDLKLCFHSRDQLQLFTDGILSKWNAIWSESK